MKKNQCTVKSRKERQVKKNMKYSMKLFVKNTFSGRQGKGKINFLTQFQNFNLQHHRKY